MFAAVLPVDWTTAGDPHPAPVVTEVFTVSGDRQDGEG